MKTGLKSLSMVQNDQYLNGPPRHVTLSFDYRTPILSGIQMVTVSLSFVLPCSMTCQITLLRVASR